MFNLIKKIFNKEKQYDYQIIKTPFDVYEDDIKEKLFNQCPICGHQNKIDGGLTDGTYIYYTCQNNKCRAQWKIKE